MCDWYMAYILHPESLFFINLVKIPQLKITQDFTRLCYTPDSILGRLTQYGAGLKMVLAAPKQHQNETHFYMRGSSRLLHFYIIIYILDLGCVYLQTAVYQL